MTEPTTMRGHPNPGAATCHPDAPLSPGLYIVAGPIGNLGDLTARAADWLRRADVVACEDTRVTAKLLQAAGSQRPMVTHHDHSSTAATEALLERMTSQAVALVSDAGTPLISDPGFELVREARLRGISVTTAPGPSAAIAALSIAGLPSDRFLFAGFLPAKSAARRRAIAELAGVPATLVFYESGPRLAAMLSDLAQALGGRDAVVARELTKRHEEIVAGRLADLAARYAQAPPPRGEIVVLAAPPGAAPVSGPDAVEAALTAAMATMKMGQAASSVASALGVPREQVYALALALKARA